MTKMLYITNLEFNERTRQIPVDDQGFIHNWEVHASEEEEKENNEVYLMFKLHRLKVTFFILLNFQNPADYRNLLQVKYTLLLLVP